MLQIIQAHHRGACRLAMAALFTLTALGQNAAAGLPETIERIKPSLVAIGTVQRTRTLPSRPSVLVSSSATAHWWQPTPMWRRS